MNLFAISLQSLSLPDSLFILKHEIAILNRNTAISCFKIAILRFNITIASLLLTFIFRLEPFYHQAWVIYVPVLKRLLS